MSAVIPAPTVAGTSRGKPPVVLSSKDSVLTKSAAANAVLADDPAELQQPPRLTVGTAGDHSAVYQFLMAVFQGPSRDSFLAGLDDPFYEPRDRLLIKQGPRILGHAHLTSRVMHFGSLQFPVAGLHWLGTMPEFRGCGLARQLLKAADDAMRADQAMLGVLSTRIPHFFRAAGWAVCGRHSHARAGARDLLAQLSAKSKPVLERDPLIPQPILTIRPWRQVELPALERIYAANTASAIGAYQRTESYWRWLISRKNFDQIYVAIDGPERSDLDESTASIIGFVVTKEDHIIELMTMPGLETVAEQLLARACGEAIERDFHTVVLHAPPHDPLYRLFQFAGGSLYQHEAHQGEVFMARLLDPLGFLRALTPELHRRADEASLPRPCELGLLVEGQKYCVTLTRRSVKIGAKKIGRSYLRCNQAEFTRLVLGHVDLDEAISHGRLEASTRLAAEAARVLFPRLPFWRPPLDDSVE
jgi:predicted acetyltransferase